MRALLGIVVTVVVLTLLVGCGPADGVRTYPVTGLVTFQGEPLEAGSIIFDPVDGQGPAAMGGIEQGQIKAKVPEGEKIVRISAVRVTDKKDEYGNLITESYVPEKYNTNSSIRIDVKPEGDNPLNVDLE